MTDTIGIIGAALRADAEAVRVISQNVANAESVAYRREVTVTHPVFDEVAAGVGGQALEPPRTSTAMDARAGALRSTGEPQHLALEGAGFFVLSGPQGDRLTRRGDFRLDASGMLVAQDGSAVLGQSGPLVLGSRPFEVQADGTVLVEGAAFDRLRILDVSDASALQPAGDGCYTARDAGALAEVSAVRVRQGFLEGSNVEPVGELVRLMEAVRHFEAAQRFARGADDMLGKALETLGKV